MNQQLLELSDLLQRLDSNPNNCIEFWKCPTGGQTKFQLFTQAVMLIATDSSNQADLIKHIGERYFFRNKEYCWPSHLCHFHTSLVNWINCPQTCLTEIAEFCKDISKGD